MKFRLKKSMGIVMLMLLVLLVGASAAYAGSNKPVKKPRTYRITITNLLDQQDQRQAFTPPAVALHRRPVHLFEVGQPASFEIKEIAENGNLEPMVELFGSHKHIADSVVAVAGDPPPLMPGQSVTVELTADPSAKYISFASMLICTNDGFTGLDALRVPTKVGHSVTVTTDAYDAGTEMNTEDFADIVPPCPVLSGVPSGVPGSGASNPALAENGVIFHHAGIQDVADLMSDIHGWDNPVAEVVVTRVK